MIRGWGTGPTLSPTSLHEAAHVVEALRQGWDARSIAAGVTEHRRLLARRWWRGQPCRCFDFAGSLRRLDPRRPLSRQDARVQEAVRVVGAGVVADAMLCPGSDAPAIKRSIRSLGGLAPHLLDETYGKHCIAQIDAVRTRAMAKRLAAAPTEQGVLAAIWSTLWKEAR